MKSFITVLLCVLGFAFYASSAFALTFDLVAPSEQLTSGQDVKFTVNINTEGSSLATSTIGMTYETQYLEYVSTAPGDSFTTVSADVQGDGKLLLTGTSTTAYSGSGVFVYVTFKLIATGPGSTQLCALYNPQTPTATPGPASTSAPVPTSPPGSAPVVPTSLPKTGESEPMIKGIVLTSFFFILATGSFFIFKKI